MQDVAPPKVGMQTSNNPKYLRLWHEINYSEFCGSSSGLKWIKYLKGGTFRRWYGNLEYLLWYNYKPEFILQQRNARVLDINFLTKKKCTWSDITCSNNAFRLAPMDTFYDISGHCYFPNEEDQYWTLGAVNTPVFNLIKKVFNSTQHCQCGDVAKYILPILGTNLKEIISKNVERNVCLSKQDWDAHETSWDFEANPLVALRNRFIEEGDPQTSFTLSAFVNEFKTLWEDRFRQLHANEEELNRQFIEIYGLQDELTPNVPLEDITILQQGEIAIEDNQLVWNDAVLIKQLISYAIGVTVGRYRLDRPGLHIAHPAPTSDELAAYDYCGKSVEIDDDAIIPILPDDSPFADNLCNRVKEFIRVVFGDDMLTANLNFIEQALGKPINDYLQKDFHTDHKKMYQNLPIYWLFSSKKGAFRCLVYMHRMNRFTVDRVRTKYLLPYIEYLENTIADMESAFADLSTPERRQLDKYRKVLLECKEYHTALHDVASRMIEFDLDDGVLHNYQLFTPVLAKLK